VRTFSHDKNLTKLGTLVKEFGGVCEKILLWIIISGDSFFAATEIGGCGLD
jgi:hypothetical protein